MIDLIAVEVGIVVAAVVLGSQGLVLLRRRGQGRLRARETMKPVVRARFETGEALPGLVADVRVGWVR